MFTLAICSLYLALRNRLKYDSLYYYENVNLAYWWIRFVGLIMTASYKDCINENLDFFKSVVCKYENFIHRNIHAAPLVYLG
jgi:hypothetical protein